MVAEVPPLFLSRIKSNSPYRTLFEEVIGRGNAVTRQAAAERFPCLPMLAGVIANQDGGCGGEKLEKDVEESWRTTAVACIHLMHA